MAQHLLIGDIASLLVVLGLTGPMLAPLLRLSWTRWLRPLTHPVAGS
jgi:putative membrane protein